MDSLEGFEWASNITLEDFYKVKNQNPRYVGRLGPPKAVENGVPLHQLRKIGYSGLYLPSKQKEEKK